VICSERLIRVTYDVDALVLVVFLGLLRVKESVRQPQARGQRSPVPFCNCQTVESLFLGCLSSACAEGAD
jgi:hypothetical protein